MEENVIHPMTRLTKKAVAVTSLGVPSCLSCFKPPFYDAVEGFSNVIRSTLFVSLRRLGFLCFRLRVFNRRFNVSFEKRMTETGV